MQARRLNVSQRALTDLLEDYEYTSQFNPIAARRLLDDLNAKMASLAKLGLTGSPREFVPGLRAFPFRGRCIYFVIDETTMRVLRVLHGHQDVSADNFPTDET
ncbi:type II toxin-antitoxin system RelE/ParE family toxin [Neorhizobium galegae]|uniref:Plasmid stabilization system n=1 Tax=Neorhizobium galegae bv. officinalis TaxID=323656 RepID=A0A0T7GT59_NEOGA|nr:type II toxin-antitoxin system RelE/ParE family toxin [Neorhizobium galegae]CDZ50473.1 Hypothetical protein NGAL_HAMBI1189_34770 [Neorhizobium galegae bv. officinalis]